MIEIFERIYDANYWDNDESVSGAGSTLEATAVIRRELPNLLRTQKVRQMLDIPCGDLNWISQVKIDSEVEYIGADIVPKLISENRAKFPKTEFRVLDITKDELPTVDLVLVRDLFGHFSNADVKKALANIRRSGARFLVATTFPKRKNHGDIKTGEWRPLNLGSLWGLPTPIQVINEECTTADGKFADKSLGVWRLDDER